MSKDAPQTTQPPPGGLVATLTLVSQSPQRIRLLREAGYRFELVAPRLREPEEKRAALSPAQHAQALAYFKARSVADDFSDRLLLGADTIVAVGAAVFGKPADRAEARCMLELLTSTPHEVITGVALLAPALDRRLIAHDATRVFMRPLTGRQLDEYLDCGTWRDKAGGYGLQAGADAFVERIEGSYSNVIGLPLELLARMLEQFHS